MKLLYPAIFPPLNNRSVFTAEVRALPGFITEGNDLIEAIKIELNTASGWILNEIEKGNESPAASGNIKAPNGGFVNLLRIIYVPQLLQTSPYHTVFFK